MIPNDGKNAPLFLVLLRFYSLFLLNQSSINSNTTEYSIIPNNPTKPIDYTDHQKDTYKLMPSRF
ncbi:hypothetical protein amad1_17725 [Alteromonas mediterranea DE1]|uniref:Uncharacterized protein n=1 Tax=Alteromonas mediterranea TaxID=314275 RepID=A0AAC9F7H4_9ALTE|nr:hypothetical protein amad1_17725 [Alteromonas mediterranea DE1]AMJ79943.1 hypothetical protein AV942_17455 [Alteromonas mediterranea]AMJ84098.1 hypothetical protein AV941_17530 [Alteromonas mediterranea]